MLNLTNVLITNLRSQMSELIKSQKQQLIIDGMPACKLPELDVNNPEILKFVHNVPPLECSPEDWVVVQGSKLILQDKIKKQFGPILCAFRGKLIFNSNKKNDNIIL